MKSLMKKVLIILSMMLLALSCTKTGEVKTLNLASLMTDYEARDGETLTGIMDGNYKITIADGATVTLKNAVIYGVNDREYKWAGITAQGNATLVLVGNNIVRGFDSSFPGIFVPEGKTLTITGAGKLDVSSNGYAPGIGSEDEYGKNGGNIVIQGGTIRATGGEYSAGIGTGEGNATCGDILISGGTVTAEGECDAAGIGTGARGSVGSITITNDVTQVTVKKRMERTPHSIGGGADYTSIGTVTIGGKVGPVSESPFVYKP